MEIQSCHLSGSSMGIGGFSWVNLEVLDGRYISVSANSRGNKCFDETGTCCPHYNISCIMKRSVDVPHEMAERDIGNLFRQPSCLDRLRLVSVKVYIQLFTSLQIWFTVSSSAIRGMYEMNILHDHADALFLFLFLPVPRSRHGSSREVPGRWKVLSVALC